MPSSLAAHDSSFPHTEARAPYSQSCRTVTEPVERRVWTRRCFDPLHGNARFHPGEPAILLLGVPRTWMPSHSNYPWQP